MKTKHKKRALTFGDLIVAAYDACGKRKASSLVRLAVNAHVVVFHGQQQVVIT